MSFLKSVTGVTLRDQNRSDDITKELGVNGVNETLRDYRADWLDHSDRMENRFPKKSFKYTPQGTRNVWRPRLRWRGQWQLQSEWNKTMGRMLKLMMVSAKSCRRHKIRSNEVRTKPLTWIMILWKLQNFICNQFPSWCWVCSASGSWSDTTPCGQNTVNMIFISCSLHFFISK
jgi:hypothetical protein